MKDNQKKRKISFEERLLKLRFKNSKEREFLFEDKKKEVKKRASSS